MPLGSPTPAAPEDRTSAVRWCRSRPALATATYVVLHLASHLSARLFEAAPGVSLWYPPAGLALSLLLLLGPRHWPAVFAANVAGAWLTADFGGASSILLFPLLITANYTAVAVLVRRIAGPNLLLGSTRATTIFIGSTLLAPVGIALAGTAVIAQLESTAPGQLYRTAAAWWLGDASGLLTIVPAAMVFVGPWLHGVRPGWLENRRPPRRLLPVGTEVIALAASLFLVFSVASLPRSQTFYLCLLPLVWICLRHGLPGATVATLGLSIGALLGLHLTGTTSESAISFLFLELTASVVGLGLGGAVTNRNEIEKRIAANEARLSRITIGSQVGLWEHDLQAEQVGYSHLCAELLNLDPARSATSAAAWYGNIHPDDRPQVMLALQEHLAGKSSIFFATFRLPPGSASERWINTRGSVIAYDRQNRPLLLAGSMIDITERRQSKLISDRQLQIIEATSDFVVTIDAAGLVFYANGAVLRFLGLPGLDAVRGRKIGTLLPRACCEQLENITAALGRSSLWAGELVFSNAAGLALPVSVVALNHRTRSDDTPLFSFVLHDLSRQKQAEADRLDRERQLLQLQKAESLGVLAGGIAHDFNNLLTAMLGNAELARHELPPAASAHESLEQIEIAARRAADLCQQMLAYAGRRPLVDGDVDLNAVVAQTRRLCQVSISKKIGVHLELATEPMTVRAAAPQLQQIILNLVLNAADAIGDNDGRILVRSTVRAFDPATLRAEFGTASLAAGRYVLCEVEDTGHGMPPEIQRRIFEPFFTTKAKGHGLGLAAAHGVVTSHGGAITVVSTPGRGSTFRFILPHIVGRPEERSPQTPRAARRRGGAVLVVDDEESVRRVAVRLLETLGFSALTASDGMEAVALFREHHQGLLLVLLDLMMPRLDGVETFTELQRINPAVPVVLVSGYTGNLNLDRFPAAKPAGLLAKPFTREQLEARLASILDRN